MKTQAIIPAAGIGTRLGKREQKPLVLLNDKPLFVHALDTIKKSSLIDSIIVVCASENIAEFEKIIKEHDLSNSVKIVAGGERRRDSVFNGLMALDEDTELVLIHDGARPLVTLEIIDEAIKLAKKEDALIVAVPAKPTIKRINTEELFVEQTLNRKLLWEVQTPQVFRKDIIIKAHKEIKDVDATDDAFLVEQMGIKVKVLEGSYQNIKITTKEDLMIGEAFFGNSFKGESDMQKVGIGFDSHRLVRGRKLFLGGVEVPFEMGLDGHSDADVLLHAICDAMLGALGKGDIGEHFPNTDEKYKDIESLKLLKEVEALVKKDGFFVNNIDAIVMAEEPNLKSFKVQMSSSIAEALSIDESSVNIKATTNEGMGHIGKREGIAAYATVSIVKKGKK